VRSRALLAVSISSLVLVATGCGDGSRSPSADPGASSTGASATSASSAAPSVAAATGKLVSTDELTYHLPAGMPWRFTGGPDFASFFDAHGKWLVSYGAVFSGGASEALFKRKTLATAKQSLGSSARLLPDRVVDGRPGLVLEAPKADEGYVYRWIGRFGSTMAIFDFTTPTDSAKGQAMIDSVLASVKWK